MDKFDEKVIGYDSIKETLRQIADVLKRPEAYKEKGVSMPRGLLMESAPGLGKSLMASILMEESGRKSFVFRRINEGNTFLGEMKDIFDVAKEEAPSILLLEDNLRKTDCEDDPQEHQMIAVHEAAHAVVGEVLHSGSIGIITIRGSHGAIGGMESGFAVYAKSEEEFQDEIIKTLAGKAGTALIYGIMDIRAAADIKKADQLLDIWLCHFAGGGFSGVEPSENRLSEPRLSYNEAIKSAKLEELYRRAYKILYDNRDFLLAVQKELLEHETLLNSDLAKIRESCT